MSKITEFQCRLTCFSDQSRAAWNKYWFFRGSVAPPLFIDPNLLGTADLGRYEIVVFLCPYCRLSFREDKFSAG